MVSGLVTSPDDHSLICLGEASPMRIASKSLMSINVWPFCRLSSCGCGRLAPGRERSLLHLFQLQGHVLLFVLVLVLLGREVVLVELLGQLLVVRDGQLTLDVDALASLLELLGLGVASGRTAGDRPQVDAELLGRPQQLVVLLADSDGAAVLSDHLDVERQ